MTIYTGDIMPREQRQINLPFTNRVADVSFDPDCEFCRDGITLEDDFCECVEVIEWVEPKR